jgi:hypothetical protein
MGLKFETGLSARVIIKETEKHAVDQFRDKYYLDRLGRPHRKAENQGTINFAVFSHGRVVGISALDFSADKLLEDKRHLYAIDRFEKIYPRGIVLIEDLLVASHPDEQQILFELVAASFRMALLRSTDVIITSCWDKIQMKSLLKLGFRVYLGQSLDSDLGMRTPLVLFNNDETHLQLSKSPLLETFSEFWKRRRRVSLNAQVAI